MEMTSRGNCIGLFIQVLVYFFDVPSFTNFAAQPAR